MSFIICSGDEFILSDRKGRSLTSDLSAASKWNQKVKADNMCEAVKQQKVFAGKDFEVREIEDTSVTISVEQELDSDLVDMVSNLKEQIVALETRLKELKLELSQVDKLIVDIEHAMEFVEANAAQGYMLYKKMHDARLKRRKIKTEQDQINLILSVLSSKQLTNLEKSLAKTTKKIYAPRIDSELFKTLGL